MTKTKSAKMNGTKNSPKTQSPQIKKTSKKSLVNAVLQTNKKQNMAKSPKEQREQKATSPLKARKTDMENKSAPAVSSEGNAKVSNASQNTEKAEGENKKVYSNEKFIGNVENTVFVRNLSFTTGFKKLEAHFKKFGSIKRSHLSTNKKKMNCNLGYAFITYTTEEAMKKALAAKHVIDDREVKVTLSEKREQNNKRKLEGNDSSEGPPSKKVQDFQHQVFVGSLNFKTQQDTLETYFSKFGEVVGVHMPKGISDQNKGFAFVAFANPSSMQAALEEKKHKVDSKYIVVMPKKSKTETQVKSETSNKPEPQEFELFVGQLPPSTQRHTLQKHFSKYGKVKLITLPWMPKEKTNKGFGFVAFYTKEAMQAALAEEHEIDSVTLIVRSSKASADSSTAMAAKQGKAADNKMAATVSDKMDTAEEESEEGEEDEEEEEEEADESDEEEEADESDEEEADESDEEEADDEEAANSNDDEDEEEDDDDDEE